jgi:hypothetical protein
MRGTYPQANDVRSDQNPDQRNPNVIIGFAAF